MGSSNIRQKWPATLAACKYCGSNFMSRRNSVFCGDNCSRRHRRGAPLVRPCRECGAEFPNKGQSAGFTCSEHCAEARRKRKYRKCAARRRATAEGRAAHLEANKRYLANNRAKVADYYATKRKTDPDFAMSLWMRNSLRKVLQKSSNKKMSKSEALLGYTGQELRAHIERQFLKGMGWHNRRAWHIDHIVPVAALLKRGVTEPAVINALSNLRPLWADDNKEKRDKVVSLL